MQNETREDYLRNLAGMDSDELYEAYGEDGEEDELDVAAREIAEVLAYYAAQTS